MLKAQSTSDVLVVDRTSAGRRFPNDQGVGLARKIGCDLALDFWAQGALSTEWIRTTDLALIDEDPDIRILVLGASSGAEGPGPLVALMAGKMAGTMHIPVTVVPGNLAESQVDELT